MCRQNSFKRFTLITCIIALTFGLCAISTACKSGEPTPPESIVMPVTEAQKPFDEASIEPQTLPEQSEIKPMDFSPDNNVLKIITGENQWDGIKITGANMNLKMSQSYSFSFKVYTPDINVGLIFQANTDNGWNWNMVAGNDSVNLQPPGWHEITGILDLENPEVTGLPTLVLTKSGGDGQYDEIATFYIDDFIVSELDSGNTVFSDDFQGIQTCFENNGGSCLIVPEAVIYEAPEKFAADRPHALEVPSLKEIYKDYFLLGNIVNPGDLENTSSAKERYDILRHHYNALTFENDMKPNAMWGSDGSYDRPEIPTAKLTQTDGWISKLVDDGFEIIGHTLVWHNQSPNWLNIASGSRENTEGREYKTYSEARENLELYINTIAGYYYNHPDGLRIYSWDVVNEAIGQNPEKPVNSANWGYHTRGAIWTPQGEQWYSPWYMAYSNQAAEDVSPWEYIYDSFKLARLADPSAILYYNDYNMEDPNKVRMVVNMVSAVNERYALEYPEANGRLLIEGIGMQSHDTIPNTGVNEQHFRNVEVAINKYIATGCKISITELDVGVPGYTRDDRLSEADEIRQGIHLAKLFQIYKKYSDNIERVSFWGINDRNWRPDELCQIFDIDNKVKMGYYAVADPDSFLEQYSS